MTLPDLAPALAVLWGVVLGALVIALLVREARAVNRDLERAFRDLRGGTREPPWPGRRES